MATSIASENGNKVGF